MVRGMKYHIYETKEGINPLYWDDKALEFDTIESACRFLCDLFKIVKDTNEEEIYKNATVKHDILYYDGGYLDATNLTVKYDAEECENYLEEA